MSGRAGWARAAIITQSVQNVTSVFWPGGGFRDFTFSIAPTNRARQMEEAYIRSRAGDIGPEAWNQIIRSHPALEPMPDRIVKNPFTGEQHLYSGKDAAAVRGKNPIYAGLCLLEDGQIFAYGLPLEFCEEIAALLNAEVHDFIDRG